MNNRGDSISLTTIQSLEQWQVFDSDWQRIAQGRPMQGFAWQSAWWRSLGRGGDRLAILAVRENDQVIGFAPFFVTNTAFGKTVCLLGSGTTCTDYADLLFAPGKAETVAKSTVEWLHTPEFANEFGRIDLVELEGHVASAEGIRSLVQHLEDGFWQQESVDLEGCWVASLPQSYEGFRDDLAKSRRRKVAKCEKLEQQGLVRFEVGTTEKEIAEFWPTFVRLHQERRAMLGQPGCFADPAFDEFLYSAVSELSRTQQAYIGIVRQDERTIATCLVLCAQENHQMYQSGISTSAMSLEPGHLMNTFLIRYAINQGAQGFDFLRGDEPYKQGWNATRIPLFRTRMCANHLSARLRFGVARAGRQLKHWAKQVQSACQIERSKQ